MKKDSLLEIQKKLPPEGGGEVRRREQLLALSLTRPTIVRSGAIRFSQTHVHIIVDATMESRFRRLSMN